MANKKGDYIGSGKNRKQWDGRRWVSRPVSTPAAGNNVAGTGRSRATRSRTAPATPKTIPADKRPADMQKGKIYGDKTAATGRNWSNGHGAKSSKPSTGDHKSAVAPPAPKLPPPPSTKVSSPKKTDTTKAKATPATSANAQNLTQGRSPDKPAKKSRTWLADNYKSGGPPKSESLKIKPKKKKLTNKQRKQGGFH